MTKSLFKSLGIILSLLALAAGSLWAAGEGELNFRFENSQYCVPGVPGFSQGVIKCYITTGPTAALQSLNLKMDLPAGVTVTKEDVAWNTDVVFGGTLNADASTPGALFLKITGRQGTPSIASSAAEQLFATVNFTIESSLAGTAPAFPLNYSQAVGLPSSGGSITVKAWLNSSAPESFSFNVYDSFSFQTIGKAETDEDVAITIAATDDDIFQCLEWSTKDSQMVASDNVVFTEVAIVSPATMSPGTAVVNGDGQIVFTPAEDFNGDVVLSATAASTTLTGKSADVEIPITIKPVNDAPVVTSVAAGDELAEGEKAYLFITASDAEDDELTFTVTINGVEYDGTSQIGGSRGSEVYVWLSDDVIPYTTVVHPETEADVAITVVASDGELSSAVFETEETVLDTDQLPQISGTFGISTSPNYVYTDTDVTAAILGGYTDPDPEDSLTYSIMWSCPGQESITVTGKNAVLPASATAKNQVWTVAGNVTSSFSGEVNYRDTTVTILNSTPTGEDQSIFILKDPKAAASDTVTREIQLAGFDKDGAEDIFSFSATNVPTSLFDLTPVGEANEGRRILTVADPTKEFIGATFQYQVVDKDGSLGFWNTVTVTYQENPLPVIADTTGSTEITIDEVDAEGAASTFNITVSATDKTVYPAGVSEWAVEASAGLVAELIDSESGSVESGTWSGDASFKVTTSGYATVAGVDRLASQPFTVTVKARDSETGAWGTLDYTVTVNDVDRAPKAPTSISFDSESLVHGDTVTAAAAGGIDEDSDEVAYSYQWYYLTADEGAEWTAATADATLSTEFIKRGYQLKVDAVSVAGPEYGDDKNSGAFTSKILTVGNTEPVFNDLAFILDAEELPGSYGSAAVFTAEVSAGDVDVDDGVDALTYTVSELSNTAAGSVSIDEKTGEIFFVPAYYYNTIDVAEELTFTVTATDLSGATATTVGTIIITEYNDAPTFSVGAQYILPEQLGKEQSIDFTANMGADSPLSMENNTQEIISYGLDWTYSSAESPFAVDPVVSHSGCDVNITYTLKADTELGTSIDILLSLRDNGTTNGVADYKYSEYIPIKIFVGASPWYPIISFTCADPENHKDHWLKLTADDDTATKLLIRGARNTTLPADYVSNGFEGFLPGAELDVEVFVWTRSSGFSEDMPCVATAVTVSDYDLPGLATAAANAVDADENGKVILPDISVPMAQSYTLVITDAETGEVVQSITDRHFEPDMAGMILPNIIGLEVQLPDAGEYAVSVTGKNPAGTGPTAEDLIIITVDFPSESVLEWQDGSWMPAQGEIVYSEEVKFSWPVATGAVNYTLNVYDNEGNLVFGQIVEATNAKVSLPLPEGVESAPYTWHVVATGADASINSASYAFTRCNTTDAVIPIEVVASRELSDGLVIICDGYVEDAGEVLMDCLYFDTATLTWFNYYDLTTDFRSVAGSASLALENEVKAGDFVMIRIHQNGEVVTDWIIFEVQGSIPVPSR